MRFTANRLKMELPAARRFLDSTLGRHIADACSDLKKIEETLDNIYTTWKRDVRTYRSHAINTTDEAFYS